VPSINVRCGTCDASIPVQAKMPFRIVTEGDKQVVSTDYSAVYEHIRVEHPEQWTDALAAELEQHKAS
jgi:hypothetical protein